MANGFIYEIWDPSAKQVYVGQTRGGITNTSFYNRLSAHAAAACGLNIYSKGKGAGSFVEPTNGADILMENAGIENCHYVVHDDRSTVYGLESVVNDLVDLGFFYQRNGMQGDLDIGEVLYSCGHLLVGDTLLNKDAGAGSTWYYEPALSKWGRDFIMALNENEGLDIGLNEVMANRSGKGADKYSTITHKSINTVLDMLEHPTRSKSCANSINYFFAKCTMAILARFFMNNFAKLIADPDAFQNECKDYINGIYKKYASTFKWSVQIDWVKKFNIENFKRRIAKQPLPKRVMKDGKFVDVNSYSLWSNHTKKIIMKALADWMRSEKAAISCTYSLSYQQDNSIWEGKLKNIIQNSGDTSARYQDDVNNDPDIQAALGRGLMWVVYSGIENYQTLSTLSGHALYGDETIVAINKEGPTYSSQLREWLRQHTKLPMALIGINWHIIYSIAIQTYRKKNNLVMEKVVHFATNGVENTYYFAGQAAKQAINEEHYRKDRSVVPYATVGAYSYFTRKRKSIDYWDKIAKSYPDAADDIDLFDGKRIWSLMKG